MERCVVMESDKFLDEFITSADMRRCIREAGREFTDFEKAAIIYRLNCPWEEKNMAFRNILSETKDKTLKMQLSERIAYDEKCMAMYADKAAGHVYVLSCVEEGAVEACGYFADSDFAYVYGLKGRNPFQIEKYRLIGWEDTETGKLQDVECSAGNRKRGQKEGFDDSPVAWLSFDKAGRLQAFGSRELQGEDPGDYSGIGDSSGISRFENAYVQLPNPFERGDFVRIAEAEGKAWNVDNRNIGIVATTQEQWETYHKRKDRRVWRDYSDVSIIVYFAVEDGSFWHEHLNPLFLEKCTVPKGIEGERLLALRETMLREEWGEYKDFLEKSTEAGAGKNLRE